MLTEPTLDEPTTTEDSVTTASPDQLTDGTAVADEQTQDEPPTSETPTEPAIDEPPTEGPTETATEAATAPATTGAPTEPPVIPDDLELFEFEDFEDLLDNATPLSNGWFGVELDDDWWQIFDENGVPLGVIHLPDGGDIEDYDLDFVEANIVPLASITLPVILRDLPPEPQPQQPTKNPQTGDVIFAVLGVLALVAAAAFIFKKRQKTYNI